MIWILDYLALAIAALLVIGIIIRVAYWLKPVLSTSNGDRPGSDNKSDSDVDPKEIILNRVQMSLRILFLILTVLFLANFWVGILFPPVLNLVFAAISLGICLAINFTIVEEGRQKLVLCLGEYRKTLLQKKGYRTSADGEIIPGKNTDWRIGGLQWIGLWPFFYLYKTDLHYKRMLGDKAQEREHLNQTSFLAKDYPYAIEAFKVEDVKKLPLYMLVVVTAWMSNAKSALLDTADFYRTLVALIQEALIETIKKVDYDEMDKKEIDALIKEALNKEAVGVLKDRHGITVIRVELVEIDPGEDHRALTLQKKKGEMNAKQAVEETAGVIEATVDRLVAKGVSKKDAYKYAMDQLKRDRAAANGELRDIRIGNSDGTPLNDPVINSLIARWVNGKGG